MQDYRMLLANTFENIEQIGQGGGGIVFKAYHKRLGINVVLKKIRTAKVQSIDGRAELDILKKLKHPYIPQVFDFIEYGQDIFTVMELIPGQSFAQLLERKQRFRQKDVVKWAGQLCEVADYLHSRKPPIIHCDIKPANVMLTPEGNICLIDFNISGVKTEEGIASIGYSDGYSPAEQFAVVALRAIRMRRNAGGTPGSVIPDRTARNTMQSDAEMTEIDAEMTEIGADGQVTEIDADGETTEIDVDGQATEIDAEGQATEIDADGQATEVDVDGNGKEIRLQGARLSTELRGEKSLLKTISDENWVRARQITAFLGEHPSLDERTDIYGIGATLYHILTGIRPRPFYLSYVPVEKCTSGVSESLAYVINKSLALKPEDRFKSSAQLLKTVRNMTTVDRRYKSLVRRQVATAICLAALSAASFVTIFAGRNRMALEVRNTYNAYVGDMAQARTNRDYDGVRELYTQAWQLMAEEQEAYYEMAMSYFDQGAYGDCIQFLEENVFSNSLIIKDASYSRFYYLCGRCDLELEAYAEAVEQYEQAVILDPDTASYYSDYVIALARGGRVDEAESVLHQAIERGVSADILSLLQGEIALAKGDVQTAEESLQACIDASSDDYNLLRAYTKLDEVYEAQYQGAQQYEKRIALLTDALDKLPETEQITLIERLAQVYIDYGAESGEQSYDREAIALFRLTEERGYATFTGQLNIAVLYEKDGDYEEAGKQLQSMLTRFPNNYVVYKRLAFLELTIQDSRENSDREYGTFEEYYTQAKQLYAENAGAEDTEMLLLDQLYQDVVSNGWL